MFYHGLPFVAPPNCGGGCGGWDFLRVTFIIGFSLIGLLGPTLVFKNGYGSKMIFWLLGLDQTGFGIRVVPLDQILGSQLNPKLVF